MEKNKTNSDISLYHIEYVSKCTNLMFEDLEKAAKELPIDYGIYKDKIGDDIAKIKYNAKMLSDDIQLLKKKKESDNKPILTKSFKEYYNTILNMNNCKKLYIITNGLSIIQETVPDEKTDSNKIISETAVFKTESDANLYIKLNELYNYSVIGIDVDSIFSKFVLCEYTK